MSLPPLLLERLKRRRIIKEDINVSIGRGSDNDGSTSNFTDEPNPQMTINDRDVEEEIIAEDYSDDDNINDDDRIGNLDRDEANQRNELSIYRQGEDRVEDDSVAKSVIGCPNKYNIYHECSQYCVSNYSQPGNLSPTIEQRKQLALVLRTYPMSNEWTVVYDPGVRTFYFWNIMTNLVSWFPPAMNGLVSLSADEIRKSMKKINLDLWTGEQYHPNHPSS